MRFQISRITNSVVTSDQPLAAGNHVVRVNFKYDGGGIGKGATANLAGGRKAGWRRCRFRRRYAVRFSLDETFDVGEDTGTPVVEDYADKMPFQFTGTLKKFVVVLEPLKLSDEEQQSAARGIGEGDDGRSMNLQEGRDPAMQTRTDDMARIAGGTFRMGSDAHYPEERPAHDVTVDDFWIDRHAVTNADFAAFVAATDYVTFAERPFDPSLYPGARPELLTPGSAVFRMPSRPVRPRDLRDWWEYVPRADWRHPEGPASTIAGRESEPVVHVAYEDAAAYAAWAGKDLPTEAEWEFAARGGLDGAAYCWGDEFTPGRALDGQHLAGRVSLAEPDIRRVSGARAGRLLPRQWLWPVRYGRQCLAVDQGLVCRRPRARSQPAVLRAAQPARRRRDAKLRSGGSLGRASRAR